MLEKETVNVCEMYKLIESYSVPTPPEDIAVYATLPPCVTAIKNTIDKAVGEQDSYVDKFCQHLQQDINQLNKNVLAVKEQAEVKERREKEVVIVYQNNVLKSFIISKYTLQFKMLGSLRFSFVKEINTFMQKRLT